MAGTGGLTPEQYESLFGEPPPMEAEPVPNTLRLELTSDRPSRRRPDQAPPPSNALRNSPPTYNTTAVAEVPALASAQRRRWTGSLTRKRVMIPVGVVLALVGILALSETGSDNTSLVDSVPAQAPIFAADTSPSAEVLGIAQTAPLQDSIVGPAPTTTSPRCHPNYSPCVPIVAGDLDCDDIKFQVAIIGGADPYELDGKDNDGIGCERYE